MEEFMKPDGNIRVEVFFHMWHSRLGAPNVFTAEELVQFVTENDEPYTKNSTNAEAYIFATALWDMILKSYFSLNEKPSYYIGCAIDALLDYFSDYNGKHADSEKLFIEFRNWLQNFHLDDFAKSNWYDLCPNLRLLAPNVDMLRGANDESKKFYMLTTLKALPVRTLNFPLEYFEVKSVANKRMLPKLVRIQSTNSTVLYCRLTTFFLLEFFSIFVMSFTVFGLQITLKLYKCCFSY